MFLLFVVEMKSTLARCPTYVEASSLSETVKIKNILKDLKLK